jgi:DNA-binding transcriptional ArsR family regulator
MPRDAVPPRLVKARTIVLCALLAFASLETALAVIGASTATATAPRDTFGINGLRVPADPVFVYSIPLAAAGWVAVGAVLFQGRITGGVRRSQVKSLFASRGFPPDVFDLMVTMRGGVSRITLLENMETPKNRLELSELTGIDWREVDREVSILEKYGLIKIYAQSGTVKMYQVTEQGKVLRSLVEELAKRPSSAPS